MLDDNDKQKIKDLWVNGASRDSIAIALGKGKDDVQEYINRISPFFENKRVKIEKTRVRDNEYSEVNLLGDYKAGASYKYLKDKYHIGSGKVDKLIKEHTELLAEHNKNAIKFSKENRFEAIENLPEIQSTVKTQIIKKEKKKEKMKHISVDKFFGKKIVHLNFKTYCKLEFRNSVQIYTNTTLISQYGNYKEIPKTRVITKGIRGLRDYADFLALKNEHINDVIGEYCYFANESRIVSLSEFQQIIGYYE